MDSSNRPCEVCGQGTFVPFANRRKIALSRCQRCGLIRCTTIPTPENLQAMYTRDYYKSWGLEQNTTSVEDMKRATFGWILERLSAFGPKTGALLDVGCATGFLMAEAQRLGWDPFGVELSSYGAEEAKKRFPNRVFQGDLSQNPFPTQVFQAITLMDLLEHVPKPGPFLELCKERLSPGGCLAVGTPNTRSFTARVFGGAWEHIKEEHLYYWSSANLSRMLERHGYEPLWHGPLRKALNLEYMAHQFHVYPLPVVTPLVKTLYRVLPRSLRRKNGTFTIGEMLVIARKKSL